MKKIIFIILLFVLYNCCLAQNNKKDLPIWLIGKWEIISDSGSSFEEWTKLDKNTIAGKTYRIFGTDTIVFDKMTIRKDASNLIMTMSGIRANQTIRAEYFSDLTMPENVLRFCNNDMDSPSAVYYQKLSDVLIYLWTEVDKAPNTCNDFLMYKR